jgi:hypothetical protein
MHLKFSVFILFIVSSIFCCTISATDENKSAESEIKKIKSNSAIIYRHQYDTSYRSMYSCQPDSLYNKWTSLIKINKNEDDVNKLEAMSPQGKCFLKKMKAIYTFSNLKKTMELPEDAFIIETKKILSGNNSERLLVLWMRDPYIQIDYENFYTCIEYTTGKAYFEGKTYLSLVSFNKKELINTLQIERNYTWTDTIGNLIIHKTNAANIIPISALKRSYSGSAMSGKYVTKNATDTTDGTVEVLHLEDFNQDGKAYEFSMFENFACAGTSCTLYGYSELQDKIIHYSFETTYRQDLWNDTIKVIGKDTTFTKSQYWVDALFTFPPMPFPIKFRIDYRGRGGDCNYYYFNYNRDKELFIQTIDSRSREEDENLPSSWIPSIH